jgi:glycosyltransferase involved in cell wall biosynthesis
MRIAYILHARFPSPKAYGKQVAEVCAAMAQLKHQVTLFVPGMHDAFREDPFAYYGLPRKAFHIERLRHFDPTVRRWIPGKLHLLTAMLFYRRALRRKLKGFDLLYCRSPLVLQALLKTRIPVIIELHDLPRRGRRAFLRKIKKCRNVVCLTSGMRKELLSWGAPAHLLSVEPDGVEIERFEDLPDVQECKGRWKLPTDVPIIGYVGTLVTRESIDKGVSQLVDAFATLQRRGVEFFGWIVGGPETEAKTLRSSLKGKKLHNLVQVQGPIPPADVPSALQACDVLVYPAPASTHAYFQRDTSPLKLFEYFAAGKPVVAAELPPIRDVADEHTVSFVRPGDASHLGDVLGTVLADMESAQEKADRATEIAEQHSWKKRMGRILKGC